MRVRKLTLRTVRVLPLALAVALAPAGAGAQEPREVPVFDLETPGHRLQVRVITRELAGKPVPWGELASATSDGADPAVRVAATYLERVVAGRWDDLPELYWMKGTTPSAVANTGRFLARVLGTLGRPRSARFLRSWHYDDFQALLVEIEGERGRRIVTLGLTDRDGAMRRSDDWAEARPVMDLFYYLGNVVQKGWLEGRAPVSLPIAIPLPAKRHPLVLQVAGVAGPDDPTAAAVRHAAEIAKAGVDAKLVDLWAPEERPEIAELLASAPGRIGGLRQELLDAAGAKPLLTADLGEFRVHYFRRPGSQEVGALVLREADGGLFLSEELYSNIDTLMRSDLVKGQVAAMVAGEDQE